MSKISELFGRASDAREIDWRRVVAKQECPFLGKRCYKVRKSNPEISIGTCTVLYGHKDPEPIIICPTRLIERRQIFVDCLHLLIAHEPGNELHLSRKSAFRVAASTMFSFLRKRAKFGTSWASNYRRSTPPERYGRNDSVCSRSWALRAEAMGKSPQRNSA